MIPQAITDLFFHVTAKSGNKKTGPIAVSTSSRNTCPDDCPLKGNGCYADSGPLRLHWNKVSDGSRGLSLSEFCDQLKRLPGGTLFRHNQAGDLPVLSDKETIDKDALSAIVRASKRLKAFTYTHHQLFPANLETIEEANNNGFTINISTNNTSEAVLWKRATSAPIVTLLPMNAPNVQEVEGVRVVACPAEKSDKVSCATCQLCADSKRDYIIGFRAHGTSKKKANIIASA